MEEFRFSDGKTLHECDVALIKPTPVAHFVLKGEKEMVDQEFSRLFEWTIEQRKTLNETGYYCLNHSPLYQFDLMLLPNCQKPTQTFVLLCDFERSTCQVEYVFPHGRKNGDVPYVFDNLAQLDKTVACWVRFREFVQAIVE